MGFPGSSAGKESACNAGDPGSITGSGKSVGEGIGYPLQYSWAFLVAQIVKNLPAMQETCVLSLGWEDSLEEGMATHFNILVWRIFMDRGAWWAIVRHNWETKHNVVKYSKFLFSVLSVRISLEVGIPPKRSKTEKEQRIFQWKRIKLCNASWEIPLFLGSG